MLSPVFLSGQRCTLQFRQQFHSTQLFFFFSFLYPFLLFPYHLSLLWLPRKQLLQFVGIIIPVFFAANSNRPSAGFFRDSATDWKFCLSFFFFCLFFRSPPILLQSERNETKEEEEEEEEEPADPAESLARPSSVSTCSAVRAAAAVAAAAAACSACASLYYNNPDRSRIYYIPKLYAAAADWVFSLLQ